MADIDPTHPNYPIDEAEEGGRHTWSPPADFIENSEEYVVHLELPGVRREDIHLEEHDDRLHVYGVREDAFDRECRVASQECRRGPFSRTIPLPSGIDREAINATLDQGVLSVRLPKAAERQPRRVTIT